MRRTPAQWRDHLRSLLSVTSTHRRDVARDILLDSFPETPAEFVELQRLTWSRSLCFPLRVLDDEIITGEFVSYVHWTVIEHAAIRRSDGEILWRRVPHPPGPFERALDLAEHSPAGLEAALQQYGFTIDQRHTAVVRTAE